MSSPLPISTLSDDALLASPSKSRAAALTASNWATVMHWLTRLFSPSPIPIFERDDATLTYLLSLVHANDAADAERDLLHRARLEALEEFENVKTESDHDVGPAGTLIRELESSLSPDGQSALDALASSAIALGVLPPYTISSMAEAITSLTRSSFITQQHIARLSDLQRELEREIEKICHAIDELRSSIEDESSSTSLRNETALWTRETKQLTLKTAEYRDRLASLGHWSRSLSGPLFPDINTLELQVQQCQSHLKALEDEIRVCHGLPADVEVARAEIQRAQGELEHLRRRREEFFGRMVER